MNKHILWMLGSLVVAGAVWGSTGTTRIASSARWVFEADLVNLKQSETGTRLLRYIQNGPSSNQIAAASAIFRLDPFQDLDSITLWGRASQPGDNTILLKGRFDVPHLETIVRGNARYHGSTYGPYTLHSWVDDGKEETERQFGTFHPSGILIISKRRQAVEEALDTLDGRRSPLNPIETFGFSFPSNVPLFYASAETVPTGFPLPESSRATIRSTWIEASEQDKKVHVGLGLQTADADSARLLRDVVQGLVAIGQMAQDPDVLELMLPARVDQDGPRVRISISASPDLVFRMLLKQMESSTGIPPAVPR